MRWNFIVLTFYQKCWNFSMDLLNLPWNFVRKTPKKALNFFYNLYSKCAEILLFYVFSRALIFFYGCAEFVLKLCKKWAEILLFYVFSKALKFFLRMCWVCSETLQMRWNFIVLTFYQKCWNFSTDLLNLRWNFVRNTPKKSAEFFSRLVLKMRWNFIILRFLKSADIFLGMCWICIETL